MSSHSFDAPMGHLHFQDSSPTSNHFRTAYAVAAAAVAASACVSPSFPIHSPLPTARSNSFPVPYLVQHQHHHPDQLGAGPSDPLPFLHAPLPQARFSLDSFDIVDPAPPKILNDVFFSPAHNESPEIAPIDSLGDAPYHFGRHSPAETLIDGSGRGCDPLDISSPASELTVFSDTPPSKPLLLGSALPGGSSWGHDEADSAAGSELSTRLPSPAPSSITDVDSASIACSLQSDLVVAPADLFPLGDVNPLGSADDIFSCPDIPNKSDTLPPTGNLIGPDLLAIGSSKPTNGNGNNSIDPSDAPPIQRGGPLNVDNFPITSDVFGDTKFAHSAAGARESIQPTIFEQLIASSVDWCRYCGTTEGINWRPGPWGKRTLCNKHGCDYKGYGFASKMPRLNLRDFDDEPLSSRIRPVLQSFCQECQSGESIKGNILVHCDGCHRAYHQECYPGHIPSSALAGSKKWYCESGCADNLRRRKIVVELPKKRLPYMCAQRHNSGSTSPSDKTKTTAPSPAAAPRSRKRANRAIDLTASATEQPRAKARKSTRSSRPTLRRLEAGATQA